MVRIKKNLFSLLQCVSVLLFLIWTTNPLPTSAQSTLRWSLPQRIRGIAGDSDPPILVADQNRTVHAFNSQWTGAFGRSDLAVYYTQWTREKGWSNPVDILLSPYKGQATILDAFLDARGMFHVIFFGGVGEDAQIYYSRAPAVEASRAAAWSPPKMIGIHAETLASGAIRGDANGNLFVIYSGSVEGNGLYEVHSTDRGNTWSEPRTVFLTDSSSLWVFDIQTTLDAQGGLHVVWDVPDKRGIAVAVYYARLESDHKQWSLPLALQRLEGGNYKANLASIISYNGELFVIYDYGAPPQRWMRRSRDGGMTWTTPVVAFSPSLVGEAAPPRLLIDSNNVLHVVFANRTSDNRTSAIWHSVWRGDRWDEPNPVVLRSESQQPDPSLSQVIVSQGNVLLVTWRQDPGLGGNGIWYSYALLDTPELPVAALPTVLVTSTSTPSATATSEQLVPSPTRFPRPAFTPQSDGALPPASESNPNIGVLVAIFPVILILLVLVVTRGMRGSM